MTEEIEELEAKLNALKGKGIKMTKERFNELVDYMIEKSGKTLKEKNAKYAPDNDALHNFHYGAQMKMIIERRIIYV